MKSAILVAVSLAIATSGPAAAQYAPGSIGNGGRMPETMSPGALPPPPTLSAPAITPPASSAPPPAASWGARYPNTESLARDRVQSQGSRVEKVTPRVDGSLDVDARRAAVPSRPQGVPTRIVIHPDGRMVEEW